MGRETSPYIVGEFWLDKRRDGKSPEVWQIARYETGSRSVIYRSTRKRSLEDAKAVIHAHVEAERAKGHQDPRDARVIPMLFLYWKEKGRKNINHDQTARSLRTFIGFLDQDEAGLNAVVTDMVPALFERFREWRMGRHTFHWTWGDKEGDYASEGVAGDTVDRNLNDIRAAIGHAEDNMRINYAPKIKAVDRVYLNPLRERVLTLDELARIAWYAYHSPALFRFVALQLCTSVRPEAAKKFDPMSQYNDRTGLIDLQPDAAPRTKKRNAIIPAIRPMRVVLRAWARDGYDPVDSNKTAWRVMRKALGLSDDVFPKTIRHTIATWLYADEAVPEREIEAMLGHATELRRTSQIYAKYDPARLRNATRALTTIWRDISTEARRFAADHLLTTGRNEHGKFLAREVQKV
jgi:integrase